MAHIREKELYQLLIRKLGFSPTSDQEAAMQKLAGFCLRVAPEEVFILKGYAGTGKTTTIKALVNSLSGFKRKVVLLAPTGRAAKVMGRYSNKTAFTIHKHIYRPKKSGGGVSFNLRENKATHTIYVVDEASMINDNGAQSLLADVLQFVRSGINCKVIFVGDMGQLPPVGSSLSPALDENWLSVHYRKECIGSTLKQVVRQGFDSGVLYNATQLRTLLQENLFDTPQFETRKDFVRLLEGFEIEEALNQSYADLGREGTMVIVRSNKRAVLYNQQIRGRILWQEDELSAGDFLMVVKNNYFWLDERAKASFIANGDIVEVLNIREIRELYGYRYAHAQVRMVDYPDDPAFETVLMLNVLNSNTPSLSWEESGQLYNKIMEDYADIPQKAKRHKEVQENPYFNALQVKYAYAVTCHKAQGGQWENIFVEQPWLPNGEIDEDYLRWLYTAITRAKEKVYLIGFKEEYFA